MMRTALRHQTQRYHHGGNCHDKKREFCGVWIETHNKNGGKYFKISFKYFTIFIEFDTL